MRFLERMGSSLKLIDLGIRTLVRMPVFILPIALAWVILLGLSFWGCRLLLSSDATGAILWLSCYLLFLLLSITMFFFNMLMLELMEQVESGGRLSLSAALVETLKTNMGGILILAVPYSILWFALAILEGLVSDDDGSEAAASAIRWIKKLIRMAFFLALPGLAWDRKGPAEAIPMPRMCSRPTNRSSPAPTLLRRSSAS